MKNVKKVLIGLVVLILILLYIPKHLPAHFSMSRSIVINAPVAETFKRLPDLNEYNKWNPFADEAQKTEVVGVGVDSSMTWREGKSGSGKMTISAIDPNHKITINMDFYEPMEGKGIVQWITVPTPDGGTKLDWIYDQDLPYFNRYFGLVMEKMMGKHFEKGLYRYKLMVEVGK